MIYVIVIVLATTVVLQFFTIHSWKKNALDCMKRYDECFTYFKKSVELCNELQHQCEELINTNRLLNNWNERWILMMYEEEHKNEGSRNGNA